jgi:hypothetical protein
VRREFTAALRTGGMAARKKKRRLVRADKVIE